MACCGSGEPEETGIPSTRKTSGDYKIAMIGNSYVGKTTIVETYLEVPTASTGPTHGASFGLKRLMLNDQRVTYSLWDTAGQERYSTLLPLYIRGSDAILVTFSVNDLDSFIALTRWLTYAREGASGGTIYLVGTKVDLIDSRVVNPSMIEEFLLQNPCKFFEIDSRKSDDVNNVFDVIGQEFIRDQSISSQ